MAKYVPDVKTQRWVVIAAARTKRPDDHNKPVVKPSAPGECPFCSGNELLTPPEVYRVGPGDKETVGWQVRVVPNKYPITDTHEVFIHSTSHTDDVDTLPLDQVARIISAYRDRYRTHEKDGQVLIFCNHGAHAGASLAHPHAQLVVVPRQINLDSLSREPITNIVEDGDRFVTYCPDFSQWPYEVWIAPKKEGEKFSGISDTDIPVVAEILQRALKKLDVIFKRSPIKPRDRQDAQFVYNYYISHDANWFIRIVPRFIHRAGFELGTGLNVNIIDPTEAAKELSAVSL